MCVLGLGAGLLDLFERWKANGKTGARLSISFLAPSQLIEGVPS